MAAAGGGGREFSSCGSGGRRRRPGRRRRRRQQAGRADPRLPRQTIQAPQERLPEPALAKMAAEKERK